MEALTRSLIERSRTIELSFPSRALAASAALHLAVLLALVLTPSLLGKGPREVEFVDVALIPAADLAPGPQPRPAARRTPPPAPEPEPPAPEPEPEPEIPTDIPILPKKVEEKEPEPAPPQPEPEPSAEEAEPEEETPEPGETLTGTERDPRLRAASSGSSADSALAAFDDPDFVYSYYLDRMLQLIQQHWRKPSVSRPIECVLHFRIQSDGQVTELQVRESSGLRAWDEAARRAVQSASPMQPLPRGYRQSSLGVTLVARNSSRTTP